MESAAKSLEKIVKPRDARPPARLRIEYELNFPRPISGFGALQQNAGNLAVQRFLQSELLQATPISQANERASEDVDQIMPREPEIRSGAPSLAPEPTRLIQQRRVTSKIAGDKLFTESPVTAEETQLPAGSAPRVAKLASPFPVGAATQEGAVEAAEVKESFPPSGADEKSPLTPEEDVAHQAVVAQVGTKAKQAKTATKKPEEKRDETIAAANLETKEITETQDSYGKHLNKLEQAQPHELTVKEFMDEFKTTVEGFAKKLPQDRERHGTDVSAVEIATGKADAKQKFCSQNRKQEEPLRTELATQPSNYAEKKTPDVALSELKADPAGATQIIPHDKAAAAKPKTDKAISLDEQSRALDDVLANHNVGGQTINVDEGSLAFPISGEKSFDEAGEAKRKAQEEVRKSGPRYRQEERGVITKSQADIHSVVHTGLGNYHGARATSFKKVLDEQQSHKKNIKESRKSCFANLQKIYEETKNDVKSELAALEKSPTIDETFEAILNKAQTAFEDLVRNDLEYIYTPGVFDYSDWIDIHANEVNEEYEKLKRLKARDRRYYSYGIDPLWLEARRIVQDRSAALLFSYAKDRFISQVTAAVDEQIAKRVVNALNTAKKRIKEGEDRFNRAYDALDPMEKKEAANVYGAIKGQFGQLRESVEEREPKIINDMARSYNQSVGKLQGTFDAIKKDVLTSWLEKAWNKIKAVVNAIIEFATRIAQLLGRLIGLLGDIISSPRYFFNNLVSGIGQGFSTFIDRIDEFLATAFFDWLRGSSGVMVQLPKDWGPKGIFSLFTQLLNLSTETIWERMESVYDKTIANAFRRGEALLERGLEVFAIITNEGLGGLWDHIKESLGTILDDTLEMIKETVLYAAIKKVIVEIGKMLVPGGGFIAIAEKVIRILQFIFEARNKILDLIESFVDSVAMAVHGDIPGIVKHITGALTKFITIALDFLVAFFGLGALKDKVTRFFERMRSPIIRGIDWLLNKLKPVVMKAATKGKELVEKGKAALGLGRQPEERLKVGELEVPVVSFTTAGEKHRVWVELRAGHAVLMIASNGDPFDEFIKTLETPVKALTDEPTKANLQEKIDQARQLANETEIDFSKVATLISAGKAGEAGAKEGEVLSDEHKLANLLKSIIEGLRSRKGALAAYRGIHFNKTWTEADYDRQLKENLVGKLTPSTAAVVLAGGKLPSGADVAPGDLQTAAELIQDEVKRTRDVGKVKQWWGDQSREFDDLFLAMLQRYINTYDEFRQELRDVSVGHYAKLAFHEIPFISTSKDAIHAARYAMGEKFIATEEKRTEGIIGRLFVYLFSLKELEAQGALDVASLHREGKIKIDTRILNEGEVTFTGSIPRENLVAQHDARALGSSAGLSELAERTAKEKAQEKGGLLRWPS